MGLFDDVKEAMNRLDIRGSQRVDTLLDNLSDEEFEDNDYDEDEDEDDSDLLDE
jgi:hypothetical protein